MLVLRKCNIAYTYLLFPINDPCLIYKATEICFNLRKTLEDILKNVLLEYVSRDQLST